MARRRKPTSRWLVTLGWPVGVALTSWDYMWRTTPMRRRETLCSPPTSLPELMSYPAGLSREKIQGPDDGSGPLFHRLYRTRVRETELSPEQLMEKIQGNLNSVAPTKFARFQLLEGERGRLAPGDEYVVRMPGPWDGPVRVIEAGPRSFRLATLSGHLEAGQIEFRARSGDSMVVFEIESWARSSSRLVNLLYHRLRMAKEVQAHMWISFLEGVVRLAGGRMTGGVEVLTERIESEA
jgi:hypothetical protein